MRSPAVKGGVMDHFLLFCHREVYRKGWRWHGLFSGVSVTVRSAAMDGGDMDHSLVFLSP